LIPHAVADGLAASGPYHGLLKALERPSAVFHSTQPAGRNTVMDDIYFTHDFDVFVVVEEQLKGQDARTTEHGDLEPCSDSMVKDVYISVAPNSTTYQIAQSNNESLVTDPIYPHNPSTATEFIHRVPYDLD
jgi:hypothetical protein